MTVKINCKLNKEEIVEAHKEIEEYINSNLKLRMN